MIPNFERRVVTLRRELLEVRRSRATADGPELAQIAGYGALFNAETVIGSWFREQIAPGAFASVIGKDADVRSLFNHDANYVLARTAAGTMRLAEDEVGLRYEADVNQDDPQAVGVAAKVNRGDVTGSSFGFRVKREEWIEPADGSTDLPLRIIHEFALLLDVGPVTFPAYEGTTAEARAAVQSVIGSDAVPASVRDRLRRSLEASAAETPAPPAAAAAASTARADAASTEDADSEAGEEAAELVQYRTLETLLGQMRTTLGDADALVAELIAAETGEQAEGADEAAEEEVECARLTSLRSLCDQLTSAVASVVEIADAMTADEEEEGLRTADADRARRLLLAKVELEVVHT